MLVLSDAKRSGIDPSIPHRRLLERRQTRPRRVPPSFPPSVRVRLEAPTLFTPVYGKVVYDFHEIGARHNRRGPRETGRLRIELSAQRTFRNKMRYVRDSTMDTSVTSFMSSTSLMMVNYCFFVAMMMPSACAKTSMHEGGPLTVSTWMIAPTRTLNSSFRRRVIVRRIPVLVSNLNPLLLQSCVALKVAAILYCLPLLPGCFGH